jgi:hypothetical protein
MNQFHMYTSWIFQQVIVCMLSFCFHLCSFMDFTMLHYLCAMNCYTSVILSVPVKEMKRKLQEDYDNLKK